MRAMKNRALMNREPASRRFWRIVLGVTGAVVVIVSLLFVVMAAVEMVTGGDGETTTGTYAGLLVFFSGTTVAGAFMLQKGFGLRHPSRGRLEREQRILALAQTSDGRVTIAEVAAMCGLSVDQSKEELDRMHRRGIADIELSDTGVLIYSFPGLEPDVPSPPRRRR